MKTELDIDDMPDEVDFSRGERGRFAGRLPADATLVVIEPDVAKAFPTASEVNSALRILMKAAAAVEIPSTRKAS
ncbi:hypothetical protein SAMN05421770_10650 [Granulicella rosea]|uniref:Uncharacterized protein n=1 Tax=Granulicella rosea TaxID=474952 RepID=A0A239L1K5_9BACT|nr:hypothetical protein [Granulicella rosea]SNT24487.1 hypothetical protein SAMN05421770_10650 [Granulicella rosea]